MGTILGAICISYMMKGDRINRFVINGLWFSNTLMAGIAIPILPGLSTDMGTGASIIYLTMLVLLIGIFSSFINIPVGVVFQKVIPDEVFGRVVALLGSISSAAVPLGYFIGGVLAEVVPMYLLILVTVAVLLVLTAFMDRDRFIREL